MNSQLNCIVPENIYTSPTQVYFFSEDPLPLWKLHLSFMHFFKLFGLTELPTLEIPILPSEGKVRIFSATAYCRLQIAGQIA